MAKNGQLLIGKSPPWKFSWSLSENGILTVHCGRTSYFFTYNRQRICYQGQCPPHIKPSLKENSRLGEACREAMRITNALDQGSTVPLLTGKNEKKSTDHLYPMKNPEMKKENKEAPRRIEGYAPPWNFEWIDEAGGQLKVFCKDATFFFNKKANGVEYAGRYHPDKEIWLSDEDFRAVCREARQIYSALQQGEVVPSPKNSEKNDPQFEFKF